MEIEQLHNLILELQNKMKIMEQKINRQAQTIKKMKKESMPESEKKQRKPSGFAVPTYISPELCKFLNVEVGTEVARTEVTKRITEYVKKNKLQNEENKKIINVDDNLKELLNPKEDVTYFNIQKMLKVHYNNPNKVQKV